MKTKAGLIAAGIMIAFSPPATGQDQATKNRMIAAYLAAEKAWEANNLILAQNKLDEIAALNPGAPVPSAQLLRLKVAVRELHYEEAQILLDALYALPLDADILEQIPELEQKIGVANGIQRLNRMAQAASKSFEITDGTTSYRSSIAMDVQVSIQGYCLFHVNVDERTWNNASGKTISSHRARAEFLGAPTYVMTLHKEKIRVAYQSWQPPVDVLFLPGLEVGPDDPKANGFKFDIGTYSYDMGVNYLGKRVTGSNKGLKALYPYSDETIYKLSGSLTKADYLTLASAEFSAVFEEGAKVCGYRLKTL